jgi:hypothetical protein
MYVNPPDATSSSRPKLTTAAPPEPSGRPWMGTAATAMLWPLPLRAPVPVGAGDGLTARFAAERRE